MTVAYSDLSAGTAVTWTSSGGDKTLTLTSLANGSGQQGDKSATWVDGTKGLPELIEIRFETQVAVAATAGNEVELWLGESDSATAGTANPGNLTGADGALSNPDELKVQLLFVGSLVLSNARGTNVQAQRFRYKPVCAYCMPVVVNKSGQALGSTGTNSKVVMTPYYRRAPVA
jgi:hypothetical protein